MLFQFLKRKVQAMDWFMTQKIAGSLKTLAAVAILALAATAGTTRADTVNLADGDKLRGKVGLISGGVMKFNSPSLGDLSISMGNVVSYSTDKPATLRMKDGHILHGTVKHADGKTIVTTDGKTIRTADVFRVNPAPDAWTGSIVANGAINRGNTYDTSLGFAASANLRRDTPQISDRFSLSSSYNYVRTDRGAAGTTTADNAGANIAYNPFFSAKFYGYAQAGYFHDRIADLNYRLTPGLGAGYQWYEQKDLNLSTEGGISYLYQDFQNAPVTQDAALRLAYHLDHMLNNQLSLFNDAEYIVPLQISETNRYVLTADVGVKAQITKSFFTQLQIVYHRNDHPPVGNLKDDLAFLLGLGWQF